MSDLARPCTVLAGPCADGLYLGLRPVLQLIQTKQSMLGGDLIVGSVLTQGRSILTRPWQWGMYLSMLCPERLCGRKDPSRFQV